MTLSIGQRVRATDSPDNSVNMRGQFATVTEVRSTDPRYGMIDVAWEDSPVSVTGTPLPSTGWYAYRFEAVEAAPAATPVTFAPGVRVRVTRTNAQSARVEAGDEGVIFGASPYTGGNWRVLMDNPRGGVTGDTYHWVFDEANLEIVGEDAPVAPVTFAPGVRFRVTRDNANHADVRTGDEGVIHRAYAGMPRRWFVTMDNDLASGRRGAEGRWYLTEDNMVLLDTPSTPAAPASTLSPEDEALQAFRRRVVERMQARDGAMGSLSSGQARYVEAFLRDDLGLGDVLDGTAPGMAPPVTTYTVTFQVDGTPGQEDALRTWVTSANPGARSLTVSAG